MKKINFKFDYDEIIRRSKIDEVFTEIVMQYGDEITAKQEDLIIYFTDNNFTTDEIVECLRYLPADFAGAIICHLNLIFPDFLDNEDYEKKIAEIYIQDLALKGGYNIKALPKNIKSRVVKDGQCAGVRPITRYELLKIADNFGIRIENDLVVEQLDKLSAEDRLVVTFCKDMFD